MKNLFRIYISLIFLGLSLHASADITASLDHDQVAPGETVQLTLQHKGQTDSQPNLSPLKQDFEIVGRSSGSNIQIINGKMNAQVQVSLMLLPKHSGKLHIPALQWDGQSSPFLPLTVSSNGATQSGSTAPGNTLTGNASHVFVTATTDQKQPYVQAAIPMTVRLYTDQQLYQASLDLSPNNDVLIQQLGQDKQTSETRNGRSYQMVERKYLLFPQRSGRIQLDGPVLNAQVQDTGGNNDTFGNIFGGNPFAGMMNSTRPIRIQGSQIVLNVRPRPASANGHDWLPAQNVTLEETWSPDGGPIHAGDPVTRHLHLSAQGLTAAQLPDLSQLMQLPTGLRAYPDQPKLNNDTNGNGVVGARDQDIAVIANVAGHYEISVLHLFWWDTVKNMQREIVLPAHTMEVLPSVGGVVIGTKPPSQGSVSNESPTSNGIENSNTNYRWKWISLVFVLLWLGTLTAWWLSRRRNPKQPSIHVEAITPVDHTPRMAEARKAFWQACRDNDPQSARRHLLAWAHATWPQDSPIGLKALAERLDESVQKTLLNQLDRACYTNGEWQGKALLESLKTLSTVLNKVVSAEPKLASLYP